MRLLLGVAALLLAAPVIAQPVYGPKPTTQPEHGDTPPVDYADARAWMCRPGVDDGTCSTNLDALAVDTEGKQVPAPYVAAKDPPVDCFYVYPTTSLDKTLYSDLVPDAQEKRAVHGQTARLGATCRLFVPIYHSLTMSALMWAMSGNAAGIDFDIPYRDVLAAWRSYLARDNKGRGVVLVGHSQGAAILKRLLAEEVDGKPVQKLLVSAYLAGNSDLGIGTLKHIKPCAGPTDTACLVAWSSFREGDQNRRFFGSAPKGMAPLCVNPAAPAGGRAPIKAYLSKPALAPASDPPYVETIGQLSGECTTDAQGAFLKIRIEPGRYADLLALALDRMGSGLPGWGLHALDISLVQGNMVDLIGTQSAAWLAKRK